MKHHRIILLFAVLLAFAPAAYAAESTIKIISPKDGATLNATAENKLVYEVTLAGPEDNHIHIEVDGKGEPVRTLKGEYKLPRLAPGERTLGIKAVNKNHVPTGTEKSIKIMVK
ncbi:MAG: hypothetical protein AB1469_03390 [Pseudomonadota bacterium]